MKQVWYGVAVMFPFILLSGCSDKEPLKGEREDVLLSESVGDGYTEDKTAIMLDDEVSNVAFAQPYLSSSNCYPPLKFAGVNFQEIWRAGVDYESTSGLRFAAAPLVAEGKIFCADAGGIVYAFDAKNGNLLWRQSVTLEGKDGQIGTGLAYDDGNLIVSTCFAECFSLNPQNGKQKWRIKLPAPSKGDAITISNGKAFLMCANSTLYVVDVNSGRNLWTHSGIVSDSIYLGNASVAVDSGVVYLSYPSGEIFALMEDTGALVWESAFPKFSVSNAAHSFVHPKAAPVVKGGIVYFVAPNEQTLALDAKTGKRLWIKDFGSVQTPIVSGNSIFVFHNGAELVCMNRFDGAVHWRTKLNSESEKPANWYGLTLTKNHILTLSPDGKLSFVSVKSGKIEQSVMVSGNITVNPIIANSTLYILSGDGTLSAHK